jgi:Fe2+ transport system protein FeoA
MPMHIVVTLEPQGSATRMTTVNTFASAEQRERLLDMGMKEGMRSAMDQIDGLLTEPSR